MAPKLRSFTPALVAYAETGSADKAFEGGWAGLGWARLCAWLRGVVTCAAGGPDTQHHKCGSGACAHAAPSSDSDPHPPLAVDAAIAAQQLDLTESEFARLVQAAAAGSDWGAAAGVLRRMGSELTSLRPSTLRRVEALFSSPAAGGRWEVAGTSVSAEGRCACCGGQLAASDLSEDELKTFAEGIAAIAERQERRPNDFQQARLWAGGGLLTCARRWLDAVTPSVPLLNLTHTHTHLLAPHSSRRGWRSTARTPP